MVIAWLTLASGASAALAAAPKALGTFGPWTAYVLAEKPGKMCYVHAEPEKSKGKYKKRDETYVQVTHRPAAKAKNEVGVTAGYTYKSESDVEIDIDGKPFTLFTDRDTRFGKTSACVDQSSSGASNRNQSQSTANVASIELI